MCHPFSPLNLAERKAKMMMLHMWTCLIRLLCENEVDEMRGCGERHLSYKRSTGVAGEYENGSHFPIMYSARAQDGPQDMERN